MQRPRFLIIDADPEKRRELGTLLDELGHSADQPENPGEIDEFICKRDYHCWLIDRDIPAEWHLALNAGPENRPAPLVFLTGPDGSGPPPAILASTADGYLPRNRESLDRLTRHVGKAVSALSKARTANPQPLVATSGAGRHALVCDESISEGGIVVRTGRFSRQRPQEDIAIVVSCGAGRFNMFLGDLTTAEELIDLQLMHLKRRIKLYLEETAGPEHLLNELNSELMQPGHVVDFMTAAAMFVDLKRKRVSYSIAGHLPPLYRRWGSTRWHILPGHGIPLAIQTHECYTQRERRLMPGDKILLLSDGFFKMTGRNGPFGDPESLLVSMDSLPADAAPYEILEGIDEMVSLAVDDGRADDEITAMLIQV